MTRRESGFRVERWTSFSEISFEGDFHRQDKKETETSSKAFEVSELCSCWFIEDQLVDHCGWPLNDMSWVWFPYPLILLQNLYVWRNEWIRKLSLVVLPRLITGSNKSKQWLDKNWGKEKLVTFKFANPKPESIIDVTLNVPRCSW